MAPPRKLPPADVLRTLLLSGRSRTEIAGLYGVSVTAVSSKIKAYGLEDVAPTKWGSYKEFIPWQLRATQEEDQHWSIRMLRLYCRSLGLGQPLDGDATKSRSVNDPVLLASLRRWREEMDHQNAVVHYTPERGVHHVARKPGDRHYVRWPKGVPDNRDAALARVCASKN